MEQNIGPAPDTAAASRRLNRFKRAMQSRADLRRECHDVLRELAALTLRTIGRRRHGDGRAEP